MDTKPRFLPGVAQDCVLAALAAAAGNELARGKLNSPESSAALAINTFGWFLERPADLPPFPVDSNIDWPATRVDVERQMRFPWRGGLHPWLDAAVETAECLIGVESKRYEPFRANKKIDFSAAYDRDVWGREMGPFAAVRDALRARSFEFVHLDAAQLVKHAFGLVTEGQRVGKRPTLLYLFAEPSFRGTKGISAEQLSLHRSEIKDFAEQVDGAEVDFAYCSYREWLDTWPLALQHHADAVRDRFQP